MLRGHNIQKPGGIKMKIRRILVFCLTAAMLLGLAACGTTTPTSSSTQPSASPGASSGASTAPSASAAATAAKPKTGGILKHATPLFPIAIGNPVLATNNASIEFLDPIVESLARYDAKGALVPLLADSWKVDSTAKTIIFNLHKNVKFTDGTAFNADAVIWNIQLYIDSKRSEVANIDTMKAIDDSTVLLNLKEWNSSTLAAVAFFVRYISPTAAKANSDKDYLNTHPVGTGPFVLSKWNKDVSVIYAKNPNYWQSGKPYIDGIEIYSYKDATATAAALQSGQYDTVRIFDGATVKQLETTKKFTIVQDMSGLGIVGAGIIPDETYPNSVWANADVRKALCYAIDRDALIKAFGFGYLVPINQWATKDMATYNPNLTITYDPAKAKELLTKAGYPNGFKTKLFTGAANKDNFTAIQGMLKKVGIDAEIVLEDETKQVQRYAVDQSWEGGLMNHAFSLQTDLGLYMWRHLNPTGQFYSKGILHPQDALDLMKQIQTAPDDATKFKLSQQLQKLLYDDYALFGCPLYASADITIKQTYVQGDGFEVDFAGCWKPADAWLNK